MFVLIPQVTSFPSLRNPSTNDVPRTSFLTAIGFAVGLTVYVTDGVIVGVSIVEVTRSSVGEEVTV